MNPLFSIIMPVYNHEHFVGEAISSVLQQSMKNFELIIINDGSTDSSADEVAKFNDPRIQYYYQENQGAHVALNNGLFKKSSWCSSVRLEEATTRVRKTSRPMFAEHQ